LSPWDPIAIVIDARDVGDGVVHFVVQFTGCAIGSAIGKAIERAIA
jgi:hypothetical protein